MLKRSVSIVFCVLFAASILGGCSEGKSPFSETSSPHHFNELKQIETLLDINPSAALDSLNQILATDDVETWSPLDANELMLREIQAKYKCRTLSADSPDLASTVKFYDSLVLLYPDDHDLQFLQANAYYYKGVECEEANDDVSAFENFLKAFELVHKSEELADEPKCQRFVALSCTRLGEILFYYGIHDSALEYFQMAYDYFVSLNDLVAAAAVKRNEAAVYQAEKQYEKSVALFDEAESMNPVSEMFAYHSKGGLLFDQQQYDTALYYLEKSFGQSDRFAKSDAAAKLSEIYRIKGQVDAEIYYTRFYVESSLHESGLTSRRMEIEYILKNENKVASAENAERQSVALIPILVCVFLVVIAIMAYVIVRNRKRISHIENQISTIEKKHLQENADKDLEIEQMVQQLNDTREQLENATKTTFEESWNNFSNSAIANKIRQLVEGKDIMIKSVGLYPKLKLKEVDVLELIRVANGCFDDFSTHLLHDYPELTTSDVRHCCLALLGMNDAEIAVLEGISYSGTNRRTKKIVSVLNMDDSLEQSVLMYLRKYW